MKILLVILFTLPFILAINPSPNFPVVVIGAGAAGIGAARRLVERNISVIILEARNRLGGRVWTDRTSLGVPADMGAGWIHGPTGNPLTELQQRFNMKIFQTNDEALQRWKNDGTDFPDAEYATSDATYKRFTTAFQAAAANRLTQGLGDAALDGVIASTNATLYASEDMQWSLGSNLEFDYGAPATLLSAAYYNSDSRFPGKDVLFPDGYDVMFSGLLNNPTPITIRYNTVVTAIDYRNDIAVVTTNQGVFNASKVIVTVPLGNLKAGDVAFTPALPADKQGAINRLRMGATNKVFLVFNSTFWPNNIQYFGYAYANNNTHRGLFNYWLNANNFTNNSNVLVTFGLGNAGFLLESMTNEQIIAETTRVLGIMFKRSIPRPTILVTRWTQDPFCRGAYSYLPFGATPADFDTMGTTIGTFNNVFFAGEHTSRMYRGTVHGALLTGRAAADAIVITPPPRPTPRPTPRPATTTTPNPPVSSALNIFVSMMAVMFAVLLWM